MELPKIQLHAELAVSNATAQGYDAVVVVFTDKQKLIQAVPEAQAYVDLDSAFGEEVQLIVTSTKQRVVVAPTGPIDRDYDDVRRYQDAAFAAGQRCIQAGIRSPVVLFADPPSTVATSAWTQQAGDYQKYVEVTMLGFLEAVFEPINVREHKEVPNWRSLGFVASLENSDKALQFVYGVEMGRRLAKDIGSPDPERMSPIRIAEHLQDIFRDSPTIKLQVIDDLDVIKKEYPLAHAVTRASLAVPRHHPRIVLLEYKSPDQSKVEENLFFVGKGVTYDTGGADIKCSGHMRDMSRDKCGAAAVAGLFKTLEHLKPERVNVRAGLALVRNSVGSDSYVSDEIIVSRNGTRVLVANTDAEGRMVMTDLLCQFKEEALKEDKPALLFTVATLTGHALRAYDGYGIALDNGFARRSKVSQRIFEAGHLSADPFEISTFRREDVGVVQPGSSSEDVVQANDKASTMTNRGHQYPAGFMLIASGLDKHGVHSAKPLGFTHMDVAGSAETIASKNWSLPRVTGSPVAALTGAFLIDY